MESSKHLCGDCGKEFGNLESLGQHRQSKHVQHPVAQVKKGKFPVKLVLAALVVLLLVFGFYKAVSPSSKYLVLTDDGDHVLGVENATVTIVEYSDFQCPFCKRFYDETESSIMRQYVDAGKAKFVYRHFPIPSHQYAMAAAEASECAADQGKFWEYHNELFEHQNALHKSALKGYASDVGLDREKFDACLDSGVMGVRVRSDAAAGTAAGVGSTPMFFINGKPVKGAQPYSVFASAIDSALG
ncbi:DsbA family protein [Candidatus Woesearchaeota archaeon]|nr:DsbA family protein [Candidatus Woesearchaeota archaeon]